MKPIALTFLCLLGLTVSVPSFAFTGAQFLESCRQATGPAPADEKPQATVKRALQAGTCVGYVGGAINGINLVGNLVRQQGGMTQNFICITGQVQAPDLLKVLLADLAQTKEGLDEPVQNHVYRIFKKRFPCPVEAAGQ